MSTNKTTVIVKYVLGNAVTYSETGVILRDNKLCNCKKSYFKLGRKTCMKKT